MTPASARPRHTSSGVFVVLLFILALVKGLVSIREDGSAAPAQHTGRERENLRVITTALNRHRNPIG